MSSLLEQASLVLTPNGTKASKLYSVKPTDGSGDMTVVRSTTATRVNSSGLIESSAVNVPRLDYTGSTCPSILVEPQRTNLVTYSEDFNDTSWNVASTSTVTLNSGIAPNGTNTANLITATSVDGRRIKSLSLSAGTYTYSYFVKKGNQSSIQVLAFNSTLSAVAQYATFDLDNGTLTSGTGTIQQFTNGWYKVSVTFTIAATNTILLYIKSGLANNAIGSTVYAWGAQLEAGANATSYIPTVASSVTRVADRNNIILTNKTFWNKNNFTIYWEGTFLYGAPDQATFGFGNVTDIASSGASLCFYNNGVGFFKKQDGTSPGGLIIGTPLPNGSNYKLIIKIEGTEIKWFRNGVLLGVRTGEVVDYTYLGLNSGSSAYYLNKSFMIPSSLTDQECINLTTL